MTRSRARLSLAAKDGKPAAGAPPEEAPPPPVARIEAVRAFQPDAIELEDRAPPALARITLYAVVALLVAAVGWASYAQMDEVIVARGKLVTQSPALVVQPFETSVIREMLVAPGDRVRKGQVLARLDPTFVAADSGQWEGRLRALDAQIDRLGAELDGHSYDPPAGAGAEARLQARLFAQRQSFRAARLSDLDSRIAQAEAVLAAADRDEALLIRRLEGLREIDEMRLALSEKGSGSRLVYLQSHDTRLETEADLERLRGDRTATRQRLAQARAERGSFLEDERRASLEDLVRLRDERAAAAEEMKKAALRRDMAVLRAPADAAVQDIAERSIGSVVQVAEPLFTLVPLDVPLEAEVAVEGQDIGRLGLQQTARIKFNAFPFQKHGTAEGQVRVISEDIFAPDPKTPGAPAFYRVRLALGALALRDLPPDFHLMPGMGLQAEIKTGRRSVISYFLYPLLRGFDESFHEP